MVLENQCYDDRIVQQPRVDCSHFGGYFGCEVLKHNLTESVDLCDILILYLRVREFKIQITQ